MAQNRKIIVSKFLFQTFQINRTRREEYLKESQKAHFDLCNHHGYHTNLYREASSFWNFQVTSHYTTQHHRRNRRLVYTTIH